MYVATKKDKDMNKIILLFFCLFLSFSFSQKVVSRDIANITMAFEEQSLRSALCKLEETSQFLFFFQDEVPDILFVNSQKFEDKSLSQILNALLANVDYSYVITGSHRYGVVIYKTSEAIQCYEPLLTTITGKVVDDQGIPLPGVSITTRREDGSISRLSRGSSVFTNIDGSFKVMVDNPNAYLVFLSIGYLPRVVHTKDAELIQLQIDNRPFDEPIIIRCLCP